MKKLELLMEFIDVIMDYLEHHLAKEFNYQTAAFARLRDTMRITDPEDFTKEQIIGLKELLQRILQNPEMEREEKQKIIKEIIEMDLTFLPVTEYAQRKAKEKEMELEKHRN